MRNIFRYILLIPLLTFATGSFAQSPERDSIDVEEYDFVLDLGHRIPRQVSGICTMTIRMLRSTPSLQLDLYADAVDSVWLNDTLVDSTFNGYSFSVNTQSISPGQTFSVRVSYRTSGHLESYGWGGLHMDNNIYYNLGVAFYESPHGYGRSWFPSRDNFYDKVVYNMELTSKPGWNTFSGGLLEGTTANPDGSTTTHWMQLNPTSTYLISFVSAPVHVTERTFQGLHDRIPATLGYTQDSLLVNTTFNILDSVVPAYERAFGPYRWNRIGYVGTPKGSMEHVSNIALYSGYMADNNGPGQTIICHELAHAWFGNLLTCASIADMWINEGGASFCEEVATAAYQGADSAMRYYQRRLDEVVRTAHLDDGDWLALYNPPDRQSYGSTVYYKGALVWHSLRGYLGDSLFYSSLQRLFSRHAFESMSSPQLRDTLSAYCGVDLTDFFNFHVFGKGFVSYHIDRFQPSPNGATIALSQRLVGTTQGPASHWVPLTFYSADLQPHKLRLSFSGTSTEQHLSLPFTPALVLIDPDHELSDASTDGYLYRSSLQKLPLVHFKSSLQSPSAEPFLHISHHYGNLGADTLAGVVRCANRYWVLSGLLPADADLTGQFYFSRSGANQAAAPNIDWGFIDLRSTRDSLRVLYRPDAGSPWIILATDVQGNNTEGYCRCQHLQPGEYTLAVVDTALASIPSSPAQQGNLEVIPNPNRGSFSLHMPTCYGSATLRITDLQGRLVLQQQGVSNGSEVRHNLPAGNYLLTIQNKYVFLQSQMIVR